MTTFLLVHHLDKFKCFYNLYILNMKFEIRSPHECQEYPIFQDSSCFSRLPQGGVGFQDESCLSNPHKNSNPRFSLRFILCLTTASCPCGHNQFILSLHFMYLGFIFQQQLILYPTYSIRYNIDWLILHPIYSTDYNITRLMLQLAYFTKHSIYRPDFELVEIWIWISY